MYCICCKQDKIKPISHTNEKTDEESHIWDVIKTEISDKESQEYFGTKVRIENANNRMWDGGIVHVIDAGYGSSHDTDQYIIAICDDCITKEVEEGTLLYYGNYFHPESNWTKEDREKSQQIFRRRKNLDGLV